MAGRDLLSQVLASAWLLAFVAGAAVVGFQLRRLAVPWSGPPARLVEAVIALAVVDTLSLVAGTLGYLRPLPLLAAMAAAALATRTVASHRVTVTTVPIAADQPGSPSSARTRGGARRAAVVLAPCLVLCVWGNQALTQSGRGLVKTDDVAFHLPTAARFIASGRVTAPASLLPGTETAFNPTTGELDLAVLGLASHHDALFPFLSLGWAALLLLAGWCFGSRFGRGPAGLVVVSGMLLLPITYEWAGTASTDVPALALLVSAVAVLMLAWAEEHPPTAAVAVAGAAAGIAVATKVNYLAAVAVLTVIVVLRLPRRGQVAWLSGLAGLGGFWYVRNLVQFGNPLPGLDVKVGFIHLVGADLFNYDGGGRTSVVQALADSRAHRNLIAGLNSNLTRAWPAVLCLVVAALVVALRRGPREARWMALVAAAALIAYAVTPTSAESTPGQVAAGFAWNMRWALPGLVLAGLAGSISASPRSLGVVAAVTVPILFAVAARQMSTAGAAGVVACSTGLTAAFVVLHGRVPGRGWEGSAAQIVRRGTVTFLAVAIILVVTVLWTDHWERVRYRMLRADQPGNEALSTWADGLHGSRIATDGVMSTYPLYGRSLQNQVVALGEVDSHGTFRRPRSCVDLLDQLGRGRYDFLAHRDEAGPGFGASPVLVVSDVTIYRVSRLRAEGCRP